MITDELMDIIDNATGPDKMSKHDAKDLLEDIIDQIRGRIEALNDEIEE
jgi:polyhydroxyalkanoate synthesis regulator phasin